jgi:hypothetical protein
MRWILAWVIAYTIPFCFLAGGFYWWYGAEWFERPLDNMNFIQITCIAFALMLSHEAEKH